MSFWQTARFRIDLARPQVMGIVNATPDSFSDGGQHGGSLGACAHCDRLVDEGADILDIGGESTRPGAVAPSLDEELQRVLPVVRHAVTLGVPVSVDTSRAEVIDAVLDAGADIVNDVRALSRPGALERLARHPSAGVCLMHMRGEPGTMAELAQYHDVVAEVREELAPHLQRTLAAGVASDRIVLDPGIGFAKGHKHNWALLKGLPALADMGPPWLIGFSRKGTLGQVTGRPVDQRQVASVAVALAAIQWGARIVRVHDVAATVDALKVWAAAGLGGEAPPAPSAQT